jgi:hypothetical protein
MPGALKHMKLGSAEEQKSGVDLIHFLVRSSSVPIFTPSKPQYDDKD